MDRILEEVQDGTFDPVKMFTGNKDELLEAKAAIESFSNNLPKEVCIRFVITKILPASFDEGVDNSVRDGAVEVGLHLLRHVNISALDAKDQEDVFVAMEQTYTKLIGDLRDSNYPNWDKLWIFLIKLCGEKLHTRMALANKLLRVVEVAFRNSTSINQRLKAYDCWEELINNSSLSMEHMCSPKQIKLLMTPLKAKFSRIPVVIMKRCDTFVYLLEKLQDKASLCLKEFLEFCFGPFDDKSDVEKMRQGKSVPEVCNKSTKVLLQFIGHSHGSEEDCLKDDNLNLFSPLINDVNFPNFAEILINSTLECCILLYEWNEAMSKNNIIIKCLWRSLLRLVQNSNDDIKKKCCTQISNYLKKLLERSRNDGHLLAVLGNITDLLIQDEVAAKLKEVLFEITMKVITTTPTESCDFNSENILKFITSCLDEESGSRFEKIAISSFQNDVRCGNSLLCDVWLKSKVSLVPESVSLMIWPIRHFNSFHDTEALDVKWTKIYTDSKLENLKTTIMQEMEKLFLENPLFGSSVVHFLQILSAAETNQGKDFVARFMRVVELVLTLPNLPDADIRTLSAIVLTYCDQNQEFYKSENNDEAIDKLCVCLEHLLTIHKTYAILSELAASLANTLPNNLLKFSKNLMSLLETLMLNEDNSIANNTRKLIELLETKENEPEMSLPLSSFRSLRIVNLANMSPKAKKSIGNAYSWNVFGKKSDKPSSPLTHKDKVSGSKDKSDSAVKSKKQKQHLPSVNDDKSSDYVKIETKVKIDINNLSEHQKEMLKKKREDIPALYEDLSQSQSQDTQEFFKKISDIKELFTDVSKSESTKKEQKKSCSPLKKSKRNENDSVEIRKKSKRMSDEGVDKKLEEFLQEREEFPEQSSKGLEQHQKEQRATEPTPEIIYDVDSGDENQNDAGNVDSEFDNDDSHKTDCSVGNLDVSDDKRILSLRSRKRTYVKKLIASEETEETQATAGDSNTAKTEDDKSRDTKAKSRRRSSVKKIVWNDEIQIETHNDICREVRATKSVSKCDKEILQKSEAENSETQVTHAHAVTDIKEKEISPKSRRKSLPKKAVISGEIRMEVQNNINENVEIKKEDSEKTEENETIQYYKGDDEKSKPRDKPSMKIEEENRNEVKDDHSFEENDEEFNLEDRVATPVEEDARFKKKYSNKRSAPRWNMLNRSSRKKEKDLSEEFVSSYDFGLDNGNTKKLDKSTKTDNDTPGRHNENESDVTIGDDSLEKQEIDFETPIRKSKRQIKRHDYVDRLRATKKCAEKVARKRGDSEKPKRGRPRKDALNQKDFEESIEELLSRVDRRIEERKQVKGTPQEQPMKNSETRSGWPKPDLQDGNQNQIGLSKNKREEPNREEKESPKRNRPIAKAKRRIGLSAKPLPITSMFENTTERQLSFSGPDDVYEFKGDEDGQSDGAKREKKRRKKSMIFNRSDYISKRRKRLKKDTLVPFHITADSHLPLSKSQSLRAVPSEESETITIVITRSPPESFKSNRDDQNSPENSYFNFDNQSDAVIPKRKSKRKQLPDSEDVIESSQDTSVGDTNKRKSPKRKIRLKQNLTSSLDVEISKSNDIEVIKPTLEITPGSPSPKLKNDDDDDDDDDDSLPDTLTLDSQEKKTNKEHEVSLCSIPPLLRKTDRRHSLTEPSSRKSEAGKRNKRSVSLDNLDRTKRIDFLERPKTTDRFADAVKADTQETETTASEQTEKAAATLALSPPKTQISEDLPGSPVTSDTPDRTTELLNNTFDISPISSAQEDEASAPLPKQSTSEVASVRVAKLLRMVNSNIQVSSEGKRWFGNKQSSPSTSRVRKLRMRKEESFDILTFSREIPSPLTVPASGILKRKLNSLEDSPAPSPKRKRVNFSDPAITDKKIFIKDSEEYLSSEQTNDDSEDSNEVNKSSRFADDKADLLHDINCSGLKDADGDKLKEVFKDLVRNVKFQDVVETVAEVMSTSDSSTIQETVRALLENNSEAQTVEDFFLPLARSPEILQRIMPKLLGSFKTLSRESLEELREEINKILGEEGAGGRSEPSGKQVERHVTSLGCDKMNDLIKTYFANLNGQKRNEFLVDLMNLASSELPVNKEFVNCHVNILQNFVRKMTE